MKFSVGDKENVMKFSVGDKENVMKFSVGDKVRIKQSKNKLSETLWEITKILPQCGCLIREAGTDYAEHRFDTSLLEHSK